MIRCKELRPLGALAAVALAAVLSLVPCASAEASASAGLAEEAFTEPVLGSLRSALKAYEAVRTDLAADKLAVVPASASALAGALRLTLEEPAGLSGQAQSVILETVLTAESLAQAKDLPAARIAFGEVSRLLMVLAEGDRRLVAGWHVFACPMVESFAKWLQPTDELENPYMGPAMPKCGFASDWSLPAPAPAGTAVATKATPGAEEARPEPEFKPGIPGLRMVDVRDHKFLWREIDELQIWERGERISVREYRSKAIEKTAHFLELDSTAADEFVAVAAEEIDKVRQSFRHRRGGDGETSGVEGQFRDDLRAAESRLTSLLQDEPRHHLFAPGCKKWLLKLAFGPRESKGAREEKGTGQA